MESESLNSTTSEDDESSEKINEKYMEEFIKFCDDNKVHDAEYLRQKRQEREQCLLVYP